LAISSSEKVDLFIEDVIKSVIKFVVIDDILFEEG